MSGKVTFYDSYWYCYSNIVSSKRTVDGGRLVQTTAPISPGSSGGGLFDAQANLLGITTFMLKQSQNLNFAIAAEEYAK